MVIFPELSALEISFVHLLGVTGAGLILQRVVDRENNTHRAILFAVAWIFGLRFAFWRATATLAPMGFTISYPGLFMTVTVCEFRRRVWPREAVCDFLSFRLCWSSVLGFLAAHLPRLLRRLRSKFSEHRVYDADVWRRCRE